MHSKRLKTIGEYELRQFTSKPNSVLYIRTVQSYIKNANKPSIELACNLSYRLFVYKE